MAIGEQRHRRRRDTVARPCRCGNFVAWLFVAVVIVGWSTATAEDAPKQFRPPDDRPAVDVKKLEALGIRKFESKRLRLFTDVDEEIAKPLPELVDQAFESLEKYFGKLLPSRDSQDFQINGYLMRDKVLFKEAGVLRDGLGVEEFHGRQIGHQIWLMDQKTDYYRRHLLLHEATHAYMRASPNLDAPLSYLEGMAEHFGTHRWNGKQLDVRVMPHNRNDFRGHDRLFVLRRDVQERGIQNLGDIGRWPAGSFQFFAESYAWSWATCIFFDQNPRTRTQFQTLAKSLNDPFAWSKFEIALQPDWKEMLTEWNLFASESYEGFDFDRMAIEFIEGKPMNELTDLPTKPIRTEVRADRGWQSTRLFVEKGRNYEIVAKGQFSLADKPKPWISEAEGISFRYHNRIPLGRLLATVRTSEMEAGEAESMLEMQSIGATSRFEAKKTGTLYLRLNDHPGELADNKGSAMIEILESK